MKLGKRKKKKKKSEEKILTPETDSSVGNWNENNVPT
jgi:hypothetical protein